MKKYSTKWITQRVTALLLVPLFFWFIYHCISFQNLSYEEMVNFFSSFINSFLFLVLMIAMLIHSQLGCETIIEDYISSLTLFKIVLFAWTIGVFYHLFNGIRYLFWSYGIGMSIKTVYNTGYLVLFLTLLSTLCVWFVL